MNNPRTPAPFEDSLLGTLTQSEKQLLDTIINQPKLITSMNIQELSDAVYTSPAAIIRLCKKLGLDGFGDLKYRLRDKLAAPSGPDTSQELKGVIENHYRELSQTAASLRPEDLRFAADCLCSHKNIYLFGRGMSYMPITYMHQVLLSVDRDCLCYIDPPLMWGAALHMNSDDVIFIASSGGATDGIHKAARLAKEHNATVIALTAGIDSPLAGIADICLHCAAPRRYLNEIDIKSRFTMMFAIDIILDCYLSRLNLNPPSDPRLYINQQNW